MTTKRKRANLSHLTAEEKRERKRLKQIEYRAANQDKTKQYNETAAARKKQWAEDNEEKLKENSRQYYSTNKEKIKARSRQRYWSDPEGSSEYAKAYYEANKEHINKRNQEYYYKQDREKVNAYHREWRANNRGSVIQSGEKRALPMRECIKALSKCQQQALNQFYIASQRISQCTGIKHQVDHILPLVHNTFTGLHAPWNLQILPATVNARKGNRL